ncbi:inositol monophosphatase family protein [Flaviflexus equikiangi]|uniref:Histidinol phosphatase n=1 Tax=Flaviflexus equikiangi TaxID=2758573 RepID=A0ABS2TFV1_9ACTO|nr:inositol monophosphatase family protein [Flaviflexus equikiangi]MBM9433521.1 histidinol phosphatase [Flaviflexus equikiangi]
MQSLTRLGDDLNFASSIIDQVDALTLPRFQAQDLTIRTKPDNTEVTDVDVAAEQKIRSMLGRSRSRDAILGEEEGESGSANRRWIIDPIDGTRNFMRGVPVWATLIALEEDGEIVMGIVSAPALHRRWWAGKGLGAFTGRSWANAKQIRVSEVENVSDASLSYSSFDGWAKRGQLRGFLRLAQESWRTRAYGDFWSYMLLAEGAVDIACEPDLELYDMAALVPIVTEAGGVFTSLDGSPGPWGGNAFAANSRIHAEALDLINSISDGEGTARA